MHRQRRSQNLFAKSLGPTTGPDGLTSAVRDGCWREIPFICNSTRTPTPPTDKKPSPAAREVATCLKIWPSGWPMRPEAIRVLQPRSPLAPVTWARLWRVASLQTVEDCCSMYVRSRAPQLPAPQRCVCMTACVADCQSYRLLFPLLTRRPLPLCVCCFLSGSHVGLLTQYPDKLEKP